jgi:hypothetical protein
MFNWKQLLILMQKTTPSQQYTIYEFLCDYWQDNPETKNLKK